MVVKEQKEAKESTETSEGHSYCDQSDHDLMHWNELRLGETIPVCSLNDPSEFPVLGTPFQIQRIDNLSRNLKRASTESPSQIMVKRKQHVCDSPLLTYESEQGPSLN